MAQEQKSKNGTAKDGVGDGSGIGGAIKTFFGGKQQDGVYHPQETNASLLKEDAPVERDERRAVDYQDHEPLTEELRFIKERRYEESDVSHVGQVWETLKTEPEATAINRDRSKKERGAATPYLTGIALSGGGIRSATFSLGVLQKLASIGVLKHTDYLSTVSGGGFMGSALAWWNSGKPFAPQVDAECYSEPKTYAPDELGIKDDLMPFGTSDPRIKDEDEPAPLEYLRRNGNYLTPGNGINFASGMSVVVRSILLNLIVWVPLVTMLFLALHYLGSWFRSESSGKLIAAKDKVQDAITLLPTGEEAVQKVELLVARAAAEAHVIVTPSAFYVGLTWAAAILAIVYFIACIVYARTTVENGEEEPEALAQPGWVERIVEKQGWESESLKLWACRSVYGAIYLASAFVLFWLVSAVAITNNSWETFASFVNPIIPGSAWDLSTTNIYTKIDNWEIEIYGHESLYVKWAVLVVLAALPVILTYYWFGTFWAFAAAFSMLALFFTEIFLVTTVFTTLVFVTLEIWVWTGRVINRSFKTRNTSVKYSSRRFFEKVSGKTLVFIAMGLVIASIPYVHGWLFNSIAAGGLSVLGGAGSALYGFYKSQSGQKSGPFTGLVLVLGAILLIYGFLLLGYSIAHELLVIHYERDLLHKRGNAGFSEGWHWTIYWASLMVAITTGWLTNLNHASLARFYRDRLMEAYLPDAGTVLGSTAAAATLADRYKLSDLWPDRSSPDVKAGKINVATGPYPIINTNTVLVNSPTRKYRLRGGDNFALSPHMCGGNATGWYDTKSFNNGTMTLSTAMATSGAAANPRTGAGGKGITKNLAISIVMSLLNIRLGYWVLRPNKQALKKWQKLPSHFYPSAYYSIPGTGYEENARYQELSDGAHFENLALYELVRRRCGLIIVCDGGQDSEASYADFITFIQRVGEDFDARIIMKDGEGPEQLVAGNNSGNFYPKNAEYAKKGFFIANIDYGTRGRVWPTPKRGIIIYLKTAMIEELSMSAKGYKGAYPKFPDQSTGDQFFDEEQFEAYRELGYRTASTLVDELNSAFAPPSHKGNKKHFESLFSTNKRPAWKELAIPALLRKDALDKRGTEF